MTGPRHPGVADAAAHVLMAFAAGAMPTNDQIDRMLVDGAYRNEVIAAALLAVQQPPTGVAATDRRRLRYATDLIRVHQAADTLESHATTTHGRTT